MKTKNWSIMRIFYSVALAALVALMVGCCPCRKGKNNLPLKGTEWHLMRMMGKDVTLGDDKFVFSFGEDGSFAGIGACNQFTGAYKSSDTRALKFESVATTRRMCPDVALEAEFSTILDRATHYEVDGNILMILSNGEVQAILMAK